MPRAKLVPEPSLSHSSIRDLYTCPRRAYWQRFGSWGGWEPAANKITRLAYRLKNLDSAWGLVGKAVEAACKTTLARARKGETVTPDETREAAFQLLRAWWRESLDGGWETNPKHRCKLAEHYYQEAIVGEAHLKRRVERCVDGFHGALLDRLARIPVSQLVHIPERDGLDVDGIHVYAQPDMAWWSDDSRKRIIVVDFKAGKPKPEDEAQVGLYALWAVTRHQAAEVETRLEYLLTCRAEVNVYADLPLQIRPVKEQLRLARERLAEFIQDGDLKAYRPKSIEAWPMTDDAELCRTCSFRQLCDRMTPIRAEAQ